MRHYSTSPRIGSMTLLCIALVLIGTAGAVHAQTTVTVSTTSDVVDGATTSVADLNASPGADAKISLREAVLAVNSDPGTETYTIILPAGVYTLTIPGATEGADLSAVGDLDITKSGVTISGAGASTTTIRQNSTLNDRIIEVNPLLAPGFTCALSGITLENGKTPYGGGAVVCGSPSNVTTITNCTFTNNQNTAVGAFGGAVANMGGGSLTITDCTFTSNTAVGTNGGAIGFDSPENGTLSVTNSTFTLNSSSNSAGTGGGAIAVLSGIASIKRCSFAQNSVSSAAGNGGAVYNGFTQNSTSINHNRFYVNTAAGGANGAALYSANTAINAADNWWGDNTGPTSANLKGPAVGSWLQLRHLASPDPVPAGTAATFTVDLLGRNSGGPITAETLTGLPSFACSFSTPSLGTLSTAAPTLTNGIGTSVYTAGMVEGLDGVNATVDGQTLAASIQVSAPLPVELTSFKASSSGKIVMLAWETATEVNNAGFEIERAAPMAQGTTKQWTRAGFVEGHGTSNAPHSYTFADRPSGSGIYTYRLKQIDRDGGFVYSSEVEIESGLAPREFMLSQNYPNPFNPATAIEFTVAETGWARLTVFNIVGQEVAVLFDGTAEAGRYHHATFDGSKTGSGTYFVRLSSGGRHSLKKMIMLK